MENRGFVIFLGSTVAELPVLTPVPPPSVAGPRSSRLQLSLDFTYPREVWLLDQSLRESDWKGAGGQDGQGDTASWLPSGAGELPESEPTAGHRYLQCLCQ